jgi:phosphate transport system substrate-binding protein
MKWNTTTRLSALALATAMALAGAGCGGRRAEPVTIKGSDTMVILGQRWAEAYMAAHPGAIVQVTGGGTGTGIAALINGTTDICQASRPMKDDEKRQAARTHGQEPTEIVVARDGLAIYVHESNPVPALTLAQLRDIYTGAITNWSALGGPDAPITVYGRENNSGTYVYFKEHVLANADFAPAVQTLPGTAAVVNAVAADTRGIGYGGGAYAKGVKEMPVKRDEAGDAVLPSLENVMSGAYPIARELYYYTARTPADAVKEFVDYALSPEGQRIVTEVGYFPAR